MHVLDPREVRAAQAFIAGKAARTDCPGALRSILQRLGVLGGRLQAQVDVAIETVGMAVGSRGRGVGLHHPGGPYKTRIASQSSSAPTPTAATYAAPRQEPGWPAAAGSDGRAHRRRSASRAAARAAIRCDHPTDGIAQLLEHLDVVVKAEDHGLESRAPDVTERMVQPEPDQRAAGVGSWIGVFSPSKYGKEDQPVGAGRHRAANRSRR